MVAVFIVIAVAIVLAAAYACLRMPGRSFRGTPPPVDAQLHDSLKRDVRALAFERNLYTPEAYEKAAALIERWLRESGYAPARETFVIDRFPCANIVAELRGASDEIVIVGAHYDSVDGSPGADDNASGVAAMLAIARHFTGAQPKRTIRFVAFANEEPPFFMSAQMGSFVHARGARERGERITAMLSLESIGVFNDAPRSQQYPVMLDHVYPATANFIGFASNIASRPLLRRCLEAFRRTASIASEGAALPESVPGIAWSDQWSFWRHDFPAVMVTDTALYRNACYHTEEDTPETLDYERMARVVEGLVSVIGDLADRQ